MFEESVCGVSLSLKSARVMRVMRLIVQKRSIRGTVFASATIGVVLVAGCGGLPIPNAAIEGTTVTIPIPEEFEVGFGTVLTSDFAAYPGLNPAFDPSNTEEDLQRGEIVFTLEDPDDSNFSAPLNVRWVGSVAPHPAAGGSDLRRRQAFALVDLPRGIVDDPVPAAQDPDERLGYREFVIKVERYRRDHTQGNSFVPIIQHHFGDVDDAYPENWSNLEWYGWGNEGGVSPDLARIPITVVDAPEYDADEASAIDRRTLRRGWGTYVWATYEARYPWSIVAPLLDEPANAAAAITTLRNTRPSPEFEYKISGPTAYTVTAADVTINFPASRIEIVDVRLASVRPTGSTVIWTATPTPSLSGSCPSTDGEIHVRFADPSAKTEALVVAFELRNLSSCYSSFGPLTSADLSISTSSPVQAYNINGALITWGVSFGLDLPNSDLR